MNELDEIMSGGGEAVSEIQQEQNQPRDESGRFASPAPVAEAQVEPPAVEEPAAMDDHPVTGGIPAQRLKAEADKRREAEANAEALRREIAELRGMVQASRTPEPQPHKEQAPASIWDDPDAFLQSQLSPFQQQMQEMRETLWETQATSVHGAEKLAAAKEAAGALNGTPEGRALYQHITASGNPFDNLVKWHQQQQVVSRIGNDPDAWLQAEIEKKMNDPAFLAQAMERARASATSNVNRQSPTTNLPPSLSRIPTGGNAAADNDMSDGAIFSHAMR